MFLYSTILGSRFAAANLPLTAALSQHLRQESSVVNPALKIAFNRPRPFVADSTVTPVCERTSSNSYPSGHSMVGYLEGFALAQMLPEDADVILKRADTYAQNRVLCGVHYPSDVEASHVIASALFAAISTSEVFQQELATAKGELRHFLDGHQ